MSGIQSSEISVVIQGPIEGKPDDPYEKRWTYQACESVRKHLPDAEIILSTWEGSDCSDLSYDKLVLSEDPGAIAITSTSGNCRLSNVNRQITSSREGLLQCSKKYAMKMRSNTILTGNNFLEYYGRYRNRKEGNLCILKERILTPSALNPKRCVSALYFPSDCHHFGLIEDLLNIWDITLADKSEMVAASDEQLIWTHFLGKHGMTGIDVQDNSPRNIEQSELSIINNLTLLPNKQLCIHILKHPNYLKGYRRLYMYTMNEFIKLYNKYCDDNMPLEESSHGRIVDIIHYTLFYIHTAPLRILKLLPTVLREKLLYIWVTKIRK